MNSPPNGKGARQAPIPKLLLTAPTVTAFRASAQLCDRAPLVCGAQDECEHSDTRIEILAPPSVHFGKEICRNCDRVLRWIPKPTTIARQRFNAFRLIRLAMCEGLSPWERSFVRDVSQRRKFSPKQLAIINRLCAQYLTMK
jgi:hypothetical protein